MTPTLGPSGPLKTEKLFQLKIGHFDNFIPAKIAPLTMTDRFHTVLTLKLPIYILWIFGLFLTEILSKVIITCVDKHFFGYILTKKDVLSSKFIPLNLISIAKELRHSINRLRYIFIFVLPLQRHFFKTLGCTTRKTYIYDLVPPQFSGRFYELSELTIKKL